MQKRGGLITIKEEVNMQVYMADQKSNKSYY